jgi:carotenoid cleavage dioxygenase-like enzyme
MHSFAMSSSYIILTESPIHIDLLRLLAAAKWRR